jgi:hypothetical protein
MPSHRTLIAASFLLLTTTVNAAPARAQAARGLDIQPGGRQNGLGAAGVALFGDPSDALWWNPAALGFADRTSVQYTYAKLLPGLADIPYRHVAAAAPLATFGGFGTSFTHLDYGPGFGSAQELSPSIAVGIRVHPMLSIGANLKWVDIEFPGFSGATLSSDIGALVRVAAQPWTFGFGIMYQNMGGRVEGETFGGSESAPLGRNFRVGSSVSVPVRWTNEVTAGATAVLDYNRCDIQSDIASPFYTWNGGIEGHVTYADVARFAARVGYYDDPKSEIQDFTFGTGIRAWMVAVDAGWIPEAKGSGLGRVLKLTAGMHVDLSTGRPRWRMD